MRRSGRRPAIELQRARPVAQGFVRLGEETCDKRIVPRCPVQSLRGRLIVSRIERDVAFELGKELLLLWNEAAIQNLFRFSHLFSRLVRPAPPHGDARLGVRQPEIPKIAPRRRDVRLFQSCVVPSPVPLGGAVEIDRIETQPG